MSETVPSARARARRRRANTDLGARNIRHVVWVNAAEEAQLLGRANAAGTSIVRLMVESALADGGGETSTDRKDRAVALLHLRKLLAANSNNINQIARAVNAGEAVDAGLSHTLAKVNELCDQVDALLRAEYSA